MADLVQEKQEGFNSKLGFILAAAGAAVANPVIIAQINPAFEPVAASATALVAASVIVTAILVPIITALYAKRFGNVPAPGNAEANPTESLHH